MKRLFAIALLFAGLAARAQETPTVTARVEPDSIMIGDRFDYVIDVEKDLVQVVEFPVFDPRDGKIELVENCPVDTLERDGRRLKLRKRYRLAAFDEGKYNLGAAQVLYADKNILDTLRSTDSVYLEVATFQIDSTSQSIYDLKAQKNLPFRFREVSGYVKWGVFFLLMLLAAGYALKRYLASRGKGFGDLFKPAPPLPPHVAAIQALEALHNQKLWQNNRHKQYYSGLTDILRTYIAARWGFGAMEMTSDEIIETMRPEELPDKARMDLTAILRDADLVKFQIDSTSQSIYDLKAQKNLPFRFREVSGYVKWGVFFLLMLLAAGYALKRYLASRGKGFGDLFKPAPPLPPHVAAIQALEALHNQKLWQNNRHKQYYSGLTDILRTYIAARWGFGAMEMTSDEIIETMRPEELPDKARMDLTAILRDADLVKFAKATPEAEQNEADYLKAYYFVEETKPVEEEAPAEEESPKQN